MKYEDLSAYVRHLGLTGLKEVYVMEKVPGGAKRYEIKSIDNYGDKIGLIEIEEIKEETD